MWDVSRTKRDFEKMILDGWLKFIAYGHETCPETGKQHLQAYLSLNESLTTNLKNAQKFFERKGFPKGTIRLAPMKGSLEQNETYCSKEGNFVKIGKEPAQGKRTDLLELKEQILAGKTVDEIVVEEPHTFHQYGRTLERLEDIANLSRKRSSPTQGYWFWGSTGTGKSRLAHECVQPDELYSLPVEDKGWWDGYKNQAVTLLDDFRGNITYSSLLRLADRYPHNVPRRNRQPSPFTSKVVIVTSSGRPESIYHNLDESFDQIKRRFKIFEFTPDGIVYVDEFRENCITKEELLEDIKRACRVVPSHAESCQVMPNSAAGVPSRADNT